MPKMANKFILLMSNCAFDMVYDDGSFHEWCDIYVSFMNGWEKCTG